MDGTDRVLYDCSIGTIRQGDFDPQAILWQKGRKPKASTQEH